jgi:hypothetical protein
MGVDEGNKKNLLWELMKEIVWPCQEMIMLADVDN